MKVKQICEAKYAAPRTEENLLQYFEEVPAEIMGHRRFKPRKGFIVGDPKYINNPIVALEIRNGEYFYKQDGDVRFDELVDSHFERIHVYELVQRF